jgi:5-oxoprolinase (ATP-hydrolysing)
VSAGRRDPAPWQFWIDRGGTFTDCIGRAPDGRLHVTKRLSSDTAPVEAIRELLERAGELAPGAALPPCLLRFGTTLATNALLERRGVASALVTNRGFGDVLAIGTQGRPELFALRVRKPRPPIDSCIEVDQRSAADGSERRALDLAGARRDLEAARARGVRSLAVALLHAHVRSEPERALLALARELGFEHAVASSELASEQGFLARAETTAVDAYLTPLLRDHLEELRARLPGSTLRFMQSSGGVVPAERYRAPTALLSGPAGGVLAAWRVARAAGCERAVGFDMGGTSTDVSLLVGDAPERSFETEVGGVRVRAPMLRVHSVASGGGSLCRFDGFRLTVGPESAGADPGPLCYGRAGARELALTDANFALGRVQKDRFPVALSEAPVLAALDRFVAELAARGFSRTRDEVAAGFVEVANASMAQAIAQVSLARGVDPRDCALVGFGGAAGQHVCAVARALGMRSVLLHPLAGVLSALGIGLAEASWDGSADAGRVPLPGDGSLPPALRERLAALEREGRAALAAEGARELRSRRSLDLRYLGSESALSIAEPDDGDWPRAFAAEHVRRFGYTREGRAIEITSVRVRVAASRESDAPPAPAQGGGAALPEPLRRVSAWFPGAGRVTAPVFLRESLRPGVRLAGPALVLEDGATLVLDPGFVAEPMPDGVLRLTDTAPALRARAGDEAADPVDLEVFGSRFMSIAERMGVVLRNTSVSTNIKERLDYSCAVFDREGGLVANAPHIPVHLGAMGETVRAVRERFPDLAPGDAVVTNDPSAGGSHLPDVTLVTPVFAAPGAAEPDYFVASRGHHADIGGKTPGSMPADSHSLEDEGVLLRPFRLVAAGRFDEARLRRELAAARHPARDPDANVAELEAMVAANRCGEGLLRELAAEQGVARVARRMDELQRAAAAKVAHEIARLAGGERTFADAMDDGTPVRVRLVAAGERMEIDFAGSGAVHPGNLNAPRAVVRAAVIYVLRALVAEAIPLNGGCLAPVAISIPPGSLLDPPPGAAVVGGNVETSQRVVDVLLGALGLCAASQGTMNNVAFGDARYGHYETIGGGCGALEGSDGESAVHSHMTNTRITDVEVLEARHPVELVRFAIRRGSGGTGRFRGGDGLIRHYRFLAPVTLSLLGERRARSPYGLHGGAPGARGVNTLLRRDGTRTPLPGRATVELAAGDELVIETPGGGGWGAPANRPASGSDFMLA